MTIRPDPLRARGSDVAALSDALRRGGAALETVPEQIKEILTAESWREFVTRRGELVRPKRFVDFVTTPPLKGLGASVDLVKRIVSVDPEADKMLRDALKEKPGPSSNHNRMRTRQGTSRAYALDRLSRDAPELHAEVLAGRLSAHAAMVKAGFRPRTISVPVNKPDRIVAALRRNLDKDTLSQVARLLQEGM